MRVSLRSLSAQTLCVIFIGLAVSHVIGLGIYSLDRKEAVRTAEAVDLAERVAGAVNLLRRVPVQWRDEIVRGSDDQVFHVTLDQHPEAAAWNSEGDLARQVAHYLDERFPDLSGERIVVSLTDGTGRPDGGESANTRGRLGTLGYSRHAKDAERLHISFEIEPGSWLNFVMTIPVPDSFWLGSASAYILSIAVFVALIAMWLVFRVTAPLRAFARAADTLGKNIRAEPLSENGPIEVARASRAFNNMQERLRRLVDNRTRMLAAMSHDLRTPVTTLRLRVELMDESEDQKKILQTLDEMEAMNASIIEFSKATFHDEPHRVVDLSALLGSICDDMVDAGADVRFEPSDHVNYLCRRMELKRALTNLIDNAVKHGGAARVVLTETADSVRIDIEDDGPGIPESLKETIFMPFHRVEESRNPDAGGVGLGLSIAQTIIHGHGGSIELTNLTPRGLRARVSLPR